jgi:hypothetical protein
MSTNETEKPAQPRGRKVPTTAEMRAAWATAKKACGAELDLIISKDGRASLMARDQEDGVDPVFVVEGLAPSTFVENLQFLALISPYTALAVADQATSDDVAVAV